MATQARAVSLRMGDVMRDVEMTVSLSGVHVAVFRLWLGAQIIKVAAIVIGCGIKIEK